MLSTVHRVFTGPEACICSIFFSWLKKKQFSEFLKQGTGLQQYLESLC